MTHVLETGSRSEKSGVDLRRRFLVRVSLRLTPRSRMLIAVV